MLAEYGCVPVFSDVHLIPSVLPVVVVVVVVVEAGPGHAWMGTSLLCCVVIMAIPEHSSGRPLVTQVSYISHL